MNAINDMEAREAARVAQGNEYGYQYSEQNPHNNVENLDGDEEDEEEVNIPID